MKRMNHRTEEEHFQGKQASLDGLKFALKGPLKGQYLDNQRLQLCSSFSSPQKYWGLMLQGEKTRKCGRPLFFFLAPRSLSSSSPPLYRSLSSSPFSPSFGLILPLEQQPLVSLLLSSPPPYFSFSLLLHFLPDLFYGQF
jgi:hypothetical protein